MIARRIEDELVARRWPVGEVIASEGELLDRFDVSRAVLREAIRIVEHTGGARMHRGPGGGLVVTRPPRDAFARAAGVHLASLGVTVGELLDAQDPLLVAVAELAAKQADGAAVEGVMAFIEEMATEQRLGAEDFVELQQRVTDLCGNPVLGLFLQATGDVGASRLRGTRAKLEPHLTTADALQHLRGYRRLVEAIGQHEPSTAIARRHSLNRGVRQRLHDRPARPRLRPPPLHGDEKLGERVAALVRDDIERAGWTVGSLLGSEPDLVERYGVSRAVMREAIRILEYHGSVTTRRGPGGGVFVAQPVSGAAIHAARVVLEHEGFGAADLAAARRIVEEVCVRLATSRLDDDGARLLQAALDEEAAAGHAAVRDHVVHRAIAVASTNRVLMLFVDALAELATGRVVGAMRARTAGEPNVADAHRAHELIVEAVLAGDEERAVRRMARHLHAASRSV